ncbi:sigma-70 family RNA polymerase sigma factor [Peptostreptococcus faecalis]|uniref:sigma-70 family RNA polymerase sigma factor n=1 Tax=Peptostreptococcus faecalis TaxID=2045015 RepID=UPI000C7E73C7|nr:sigma-70 family RNA polymerase sigma factor [Peptostreptococcus faecalis]
MIAFELKEEITEIINAVEVDNQYVHIDNVSEDDRIDRLLIWKAQKGSKRAMDLFILNRIDYVKKLVRSDYEIASFKKRGLDDEDLFQTGIIGMIDTVNKFDFRPNIKVKTYLTYNVKFSIKNSYRKYGSISVSREAGSIYTKCSKKLDILEDKIEFSVVKELSKVNHIEERKIVESLLAIKNRNNIYSINNDGGIEGDSVFLDKYKNYRVFEFEEKMDRLFDYRLILDAMTKLNSRERYIMQSIYLEDRTQKDLSHEMNCSMTAIGKIKFKAIKKIRNIIWDEYNNIKKY